MWHQLEGYKSDDHHSAFLEMKYHVTMCGSDLIWKTGHDGHWLSKTKSKKKTGLSAVFILVSSCSIVRIR